MSIRLWHCGPSSPIKRLKQVATRNLTAEKLQWVALSEFEIHIGFVEETTDETNCEKKHGFFTANQEWFAANWN